MSKVKLTIHCKDGSTKTKFVEISEQEQLAMFRYGMNHYVKYTPPPLDIPNRKK